MRKPRIVGVTGNRGRDPARAERRTRSLGPSSRDRDDRVEQLELLTSAGVAIAGSFDIRDILRETHETACRLLGTRSVDVLYVGRASINSRPLWFPKEPSPENLSETLRSRLSQRLGPWGGGSASLTTLLGEELKESERGAFPLSHRNEGLGALFFGSAEPPSADGLALLAILAQQAATALRNIHLTQERIHFERLSAIGRMIGTIVHDLRSPLTALRGYASMIATLDLESSARREYSRWILEECDRMNHMVAELLEFTRGDRPQLAPEWISLGGYLETFAERLGRHYRDRGIAVAVRSGFARDVRLDGARLERALWNVAANGCQAMPGGGSLTIRSGERDGKLAIEVEDEGSGIPEEIRHRIFEPFFSYGKSEGIGLGMSTAQRIVQQHGGEIEIESKTSGTVVRLLLPIAPEEP